MALRSTGLMRGIIFRHAPILVAAILSTPHEAWAAPSVPDPSPFDEDYQRVLRDRETQRKEKADRDAETKARKEKIADIKRRMSELTVAIASSTGTARRILIAEALHNQEFGLRLSAASALESLNEDPAWSIPLFMGALRDSTGRIRDIGFRAIEGYGPLAAQAAPELVSLLFDDSMVSLLDNRTTTAERAERALHAMPEAAQNALADSLDDRTLDVPPLAQPGEAETDRRVLAFAGFGTAAQSRLMAISSDESAQPETRCLGLRSLAVIAARMNDDPPRTPASLGACVTSMLTATPEEYQKLIVELDSGTTKRRIAAATRLGAVRPSSDEGVRALARGLKDADFQVRWTALNSLLGIAGHADAAMPALVDAIEQRELRHLARAVLQRMASRPASAADKLIHLLLSTDAEVRDAATSALSDLGMAAIPPLIESLDDHDLNRRLEEIATIPGPAELILRFGMGARPLSDADGRERIFVRAQAAGFSALQSVAASPDRSVVARCQAVRYLMCLSEFAAGERLEAFVNAASFGLANCPNVLHANIVRGLARIPTESRPHAMVVLQEWLAGSSRRTPALAWLNQLTGEGSRLFELPASTAIAISLVGIIHDGDGTQRELSGDFLRNAADTLEHPLPLSVLTPLFERLRMGSADEWVSGTRALSCASPETRLFLLDSIASRSAVGFPHASWILAVCGEKGAIPAFSAALAEPPFRNDSAAALYILGSSTGAVLPIVLERFASTDLVERGRALSTVLATGRKSIPPPAIRAIEGLLNDPDDDLRARAVDTIFNLELIPNSAEVGLRGNLGHPKPRIRTTSACALLKMGRDSPEIIDLLRKDTLDPESRVNTYALSCLSKIRRKESANLIELWCKAGTAQEPRTCGGRTYPSP